MVDGQLCREAVETGPDVLYFIHLSAIRAARAGATTRKESLGLFSLANNNITFERCTPSKAFWLGMAGRWKTRSEIFIYVECGGRESRLILFRSGTLDIYSL